MANFLNIIIVDLHLHFKDKSPKPDLTLNVF